MARNEDRIGWLKAAGLILLALALAAAFLPAEKGIPSYAVGGLLMAAGLVEMGAGRLRRDTAELSTGAGFATLLAGLLFFLNREVRFFPTVNIVIGWLVIRSVVLGLASTRVSGSVRRWTLTAAVTDFLLGVLTLVGLSLASAVVIMFGPTPRMVASFAWVLAASFAVTGIMLLQIASCERGDAGSDA